MIGVCPLGAQDAPDLSLTEAHGVHTFDDSPHTLARPQFSAESMLGGFLQNGSSYRCQLLLIKLGRTPPLGHLSKDIDAAFDAL